MADSETTVAPHPRDLRHHFDDSEQQLDSSTLGMWVFLVTEVMFFGGMFGGYTVYRNLYPEAFASTSHFMNVTIGAINTGVLICSSFTMVLAVRSAQLGQKKALIAFLVLTLILGCVFLTLKVSSITRSGRTTTSPARGFNTPTRATSIRRKSCFFCISR